MNRERIQQIRQAVDHNPRGADGYVYELARAAEELLGRLETAQAEVEMLRGVGCGEPSFIGAEIEDGPCGACLKCARRERNEAQAEVERLRGIVEVNDRRLAAVWDEARAEVEQLRAELRKVAP